MKDLLDAFWRAAAYCLHPRVMLWSLLPLALVGAAALGLGWLYWQPAVDAVRQALHEWSLPSLLFGWLERMGVADLRGLVAPLLVVALTLPLVIVATLALVALSMTPVIVQLVAGRRFPSLEQRRGAGWLQSLAWSLVCSAGALLALVLSVPLWWVPPMILVLPPLIWGWLAYRVFSFDALARHASADERRYLMREHRLPLLAIGMVSGYLGAVPVLVWVFGIVSLVLAPILLIVSVWLYTLVFAFSAAWFTHYTLAALEALRRQPPPAIDPPTALLPPQPSETSP